MKRLLCLLGVLMCGLLLQGCAPLTAKLTDTSTPNKLAALLIKSFVRDDVGLFAKDVVFSDESLQLLSESLNEIGSVSLNPKFIEQHAKVREILEEKWVKIRQKAQIDGVLWKTSQYYGCRYKMRQHPSLLPLSMNFEIYFEVGGYFYRLDITSVSFEGSYFLFDDIKWMGEVEKPETVVLAE